MNILKELEEYVNRADISSAPTLETMPRNTLSSKGIAGPTGAHVIEEIHTPFNLAYITTTTGTTAFQNITGVTLAEIPARIEASKKALILAGVKQNDNILITYPPLVNVFPKQALEDYGVSWFFLKASSRDALILTLCKDRPRVVLGESSFLRATLQSAEKMGMTDLLPRNIIFIAAGTPLDPELKQEAQKLDSSVHDLYGCQEFGWLTLDGVPVRNDISLLEHNTKTFNPHITEGVTDNRNLIVGGLPTGDSFPVIDSKIITSARKRGADLETTILRSPAKGRDTVERLARTILRIKAKIVRVSPDLVLGAEKTLVSVGDYVLEEKTEMLDSLLQAQMDYQSSKKNDPTWVKWL